MNKKSKLTSNFRFLLIRKELIKLYGDDTTDRIVALAEQYYADGEQQCRNAAKGEWEHLHGTILPTVSVYKAVQSIDPENALTSAHTVMMNVCEIGGSFMAKILKLPWMNAAFMRLLPKFAENQFGERCGFRYENYKATNRALQMDMTACPYCRFARKLGCPELIPVFCDSDLAVYGNLPGIRFERTETLGTGGTCCDFRFIRE